MPVYRGNKAKIYFEGELLGKARNVSVDIDRSLEQYYEINSRKASRILQGTALITGRLEKAWVDITYLSLLTGSGALSTFDLIVEVPDAFDLYLYDCKFSKGSITVPQDGFLKEDYEFSALTYGVAEFDPCAGISGEFIDQPGFEAQGWACSYTQWKESTNPHSGTLCLAKEVWNDSEEETVQEFPSSFSADSVTTFTAWARGDSSSDILKIQVTYSDSSTSSHEFTLTTSWAQYNFLPYLTAGKYLTKLHLISKGTNYDYLYIDDVSIIADGVEKVWDGGFENEDWGDLHWDGTGSLYTFGGYLGNCCYQISKDEYVEQTLDTVCPVTCLTEASLYYRGLGGGCSGSSEGKITVTYEDDSTTEIVLGDPSSWTQIDFKSTLVLGKKIKTIKVETTFGAYSIDEVHIIC